MNNYKKEYFNDYCYFLLESNGNDFFLNYSLYNVISESKDSKGKKRINKENLKNIEKKIQNFLKKNKKPTKSEIDELVDSDGTMLSSKVPFLDMTLHPKKTMDQTISSASITNDPITRGYRTYYGESKESDGEVIETDMSGAFGYDETKDMDGKETYIFYKDELEMNPDEAKERTKQQGKDPSGKKTKNQNIIKTQILLQELLYPKFKNKKRLKLLKIC